MLMVVLFSVIATCFFCQYYLHAGHREKSIPPISGVSFSMELSFLSRSFLFAKVILALIIILNFNCHEIADLKGKNISDAF